MGQFKRRDSGRTGSRRPRNGGRSDRGSGRPSGGFDRGRSEGRSRPRMHRVTCDKCGKRCEVPFNPTEGKPVYCSDCFVKDDSKGPGLKQINEKLDKIMKALHIDDS